MNAVYYQSPVGPLTLIEENGALTGVQFGRAPLPAGFREAVTTRLRPAARGLPRGRNPAAQPRAPAAVGIFRGQAH